MNFSIERPWALYGIVFLIPVLFYSFVTFKKTFDAMSRSGMRRRGGFESVRMRTMAKILLRAAVWCMLLLALSGISWGTLSTPVQKNGSAVSMVFDISYSMTAKDAPGGRTRLEAAALYAETLLDRIDGNPVSAVLAKGSGVTAIPLTEDTEAVRTLLSLLSPQMMSAPGSSIAGGINAAVQSFPRSISKAPVVWVFTDGDETDSGMQNALSAALRQGVGVVIIGFGSERETEITAGDEITKVMTALRSDKIRAAVDFANRKNFGGQGVRFYRGADAKYVAASEIGSAVKVLSSISKESVTLSYEMQSVDRHSLFIIIGLVLFILSFVASEFSPRSIRGINKGLALSLLALCLSSCSAQFEESKQIFEGVWNWHQKDYNAAVAKFSQGLRSAELNNDELIRGYALYGLSVTYLMQNENAAAIEKINQLPPGAPDKVRFAAFYNSGIISQRQGDYEKAVQFFKNALLVDSTNLDAKINLELSRSQLLQRAHESERPLQGLDESSAEESDLEKSVFNRIREKDREQWKNIQTEQKNSSVIDY